MKFTCVVLKHVRHSLWFLVVANFAKCTTFSVLILEMSFVLVLCLWHHVEIFNCKANRSVISLKATFQSISLIQPYRTIFWSLRPMVYEQDNGFKASFMSHIPTCIFSWLSVRLSGSLHTSPELTRKRQTLCICLRAQHSGKCGSHPTPMGNSGFKNACKILFVNLHTVSASSVLFFSHFQLCKRTQSFDGAPSTSKEWSRLFGIIVVVCNKCRIILK